jgi:argininosuccinate lyase
MKIKKANKKIWQFSGASLLHPLVEKFTVGDDYLFDQKLIPYDIQASLAHTEMLKKIKIITNTEFGTLKKGLQEILTQWEKGKFVIRQNQEDGHTAIEQFLTDKYGEVGKKIHTGRSRNDQSLVMLRLYMKNQLLLIEKIVTKIEKSLDKKIRKTKDIPMPGYTHMQKAMPTTVGVWLDSYLSAIDDCLFLIKAIKKMIDQNPLGSASGFGINNFPLDRDLTTKILKFAKTQKNPMYCGFSRGYFENIVLQTLSNIMIIFGRFANDMVMFTTQEFNFFSLPDNFTTGSSIMPQKRNYDVFEIMRGNTKVFCSFQNQIQNIISSLGSGYNRDLQLTKKPFVLATSLCVSTCELMLEIISNFKIHKKSLNKAMTKDLFITNEVYELVKDGKNFRDAYLEIKEKWNKK